MKALIWVGRPRSLALLCALAGYGCSSPEKLGEAGDQCLQTPDCSLGLACVPKGDGTYVCSADLSKIVNIEDAAPGETGTPRDAAQENATAADDGSGGQESAPDDSGPVEASSPLLEAGPDSAPLSEDAGRVDAAHPPDAAKPPPEASAPDTGSADSGVSTADASDSSAD